MLMESIPRATSLQTFKISRNQIISIHCAKGEAKLSDKEYRSILKKYTGVTSCKEIKSYTDYKKAFDAIAAKSKKVTIKPKPVKEEKDPWMYIEATPQMWQNQCEIRRNYLKKNVVMVSVWESDGRKRFKIRPMKEWEKELY